MEADRIEKETRQKEILLELFNATDGEHWSHNDNWKSDAPLKDWYGIAVDGIGNVVSVNLYQNNLSGNIPESIGNLTNLRSLDLGYNQLSGSIPESISNLTNLGSSSLAVNLLTGSIPESIGNLTNLRYLDLCRNLLTGGIPESIGNLKDLEHLDLHSNHLTGTIPEAFANITRSDFYLSINLNDMDGVISTSIQESAWWSNYIDITQREGHKLTLESKVGDMSGSIEGFESKDHEWEGTSGGIYIYEDTDPENAGGGEGE